MAQRDQNNQSLTAQVVLYSFCLEIMVVLSQIFYKLTTHASLSMLHQYPSDNDFPAPS